MRIEFDIAENDLSWEDDAYVKVVMPSKTLLEIQANKEGLISLAKQFLTLAYSESLCGNNIHHIAEAQTVNGYTYGDLEEGSLDLSIAKVQTVGRKYPD
ncbi:MAG: hypothetical protein K2O39_00265 [Clostridiales bacterium]|nr:hypothetical protein [Clostridiales bacterium]